MRLRSVLVAGVSLATAAGAMGLWGATAAAKARPASSNPVLIGASIPITGTFAAFGSYLKWGYQHAVDQINQEGGVRVNGVKRKVRLIMLDDESNPDVTANNVQRLILQDHVVGLLPSCTPPLVNAGALVAEHYHVPMVGGCDPIASFEAAHHWTYVWDLFFYDPNLAQTPFKTLQAYHIQTNHKVAIIADNTPDGLQVGGKLWPLYAPKYGYKVVYSTSFPAGTTAFGNVIAAVKASGADIVLVDTDTPTAIDIRRQMKQYGFTPKMLVVEKGAEPEQYAQALGSLADGTLVGGYWSPKSPYPGAAALAVTYEHQTHQTWSQHIADSYTAALILLQAINRADSTDPAKVNAAIAATNGTYVVGPIRFDHATSYAPALWHASALPLTEDQWQHGQIQVVWPQDRATAKFVYPEPGAH
jgi:branched-chain amino acid transport system substrate-binding protein